MQSPPKISVLIPVYNVEAYLSRCIDSILAQSYSNLEIVMVDDASPDGSGAICDKYAAMDSRIKVVHRAKNGGLAAARNDGLDNSSGEYIFYVDSDDYVHCDIIRTLYDNLVRYGSEVSIINREPAYGNEPPVSVFEHNITCLTGRETLLKQFGENGSVFVSAWAKLYKRSVFDGLRYPDGKWHEDVYVSCRLFYRVDKVVYDDSKMYYYFQHSQSFMSSRFSRARLDALDIFEDRINFFRAQNDDELATLAAIRYLYLSRQCYYGAAEQLHDKALARTILKKFREVFDSIEHAEGFYGDEKKLYAAFARNPALYNRYEKIYWFLKGASGAIRRRIRKVKV